MDKAEGLFSLQLSLISVLSFLQFQDDLASVIGGANAGLLLDAPLVLFRRLLNLPELSKASLDKANQIYESVSGGKESIKLEIRNQTSCF